MATDQATSSMLTHAKTRGARSPGARDTTVSPSHVARIAARDCDAISNGSGAKITGPRLSLRALEVTLLPGDAGINHPPTGVWRR